MFHLLTETRELSVQLTEAGQIQQFTTPVRRDTYWKRWHNYVNTPNFEQSKGGFLSQLRLPNLRAFVNCKLKQALSYQAVGQKQSESSLQVQSLRIALYHFIHTRNVAPARWIYHINSVPGVIIGMTVLPNISSFINE